MVKALHKAGIEVILDVVFNHTDEGNHLGPASPSRASTTAPTTSWCRGTCSITWTTRAAATPSTATTRSLQKLILESLRYWVQEAHVDGFRFDEGSILSRGEDGAPSAHPPIVWQIELDDAPRRHQADRRGLGRRRPLPDRAFPRRPLGGMEWPLPRRHPPVREGRSGYGRRGGLADGRQLPTLPGPRRTADQQHQLHQLPRRVHPQRSRLLQPEAQRSQRREQQRRRQRQPELELRRGGRVERSRGRGACARGRSATSPRFSCSREACRCSSAATRSGARSAATTTPTARTTRSSWFDWTLPDKNADLLRFWKG